MAGDGEEKYRPEKSIAHWTRLQRNRSYLPRKNEKIKGIDLTSGGPEWEPFKPALERAEYTLKRADIMTKYHSTGGTFGDSCFPEYFQSLGIAKADGSALQLKNFMPGNGATQLYAAAAQSLLKKDDVLVVPVPTYGFFLEPGNLKGKRVKPLFLRPEDGYRLTPGQLDSEILRINKELASEQPPGKVTALLHINPHNPSGTVDTKEEVEKLAEVVKKHDLRLVIDDLAYLGLEYGRYDSEYAEPKYKGRLAYPMAAVEGMFDKTLTIMSLSKAYSLVDLRAGLACGPEEFIGALKSNIGRNIEFASSIAQNAMNAVFETKHKEEREKYLSDRTRSLAENCNMLRLFINGWDKEEADLWDKSSQDEFLGRSSIFGRVKEDSVFENNHQAEYWAEDIAKWQEAVKESRKEREKILAQSDLLDEARTYLLSENHEKYENAEYWLDNSQRSMEMNRRYFEDTRERQRQKKSLMDTGIPGIKTVNSVESGFFMLLDATELKDKYIGRTQIKDASDFTRELSKHKGVYLIPGTAMGYPGKEMLLRLSFPKGVNSEVLKGLTRIHEFTEMLKDRPGPLVSKKESRAL